MIQKNTSQLEHSTESLFIYTCLKTLYPFSYTVFLSCLIIKRGWRNISLLLLQKKSIRVRITRTFVWSFKTHLQLQTSILIGYSSLTTLRQLNFCVCPWKDVVFRSVAITQTAREIRCISPLKQRKEIFDLPHPLILGQHRIKQLTRPPPCPKGWTYSRGFLGKHGNKSNWTMHNRLLPLPYTSLISTSDSYALFEAWCKKKSRELFSHRFYCNSPPVTSYNRRGLLVLQVIEISYT